MENIVRLHVIGFDFFVVTKKIKCHIKFQNCLKHSNDFGNIHIIKVGGTVETAQISWLIGHIFRCHCQVYFLKLFPESKKNIIGNIQNKSILPINNIVYMIFIPRICWLYKILHLLWLFKTVVVLECSRKYLSSTFIVLLNCNFRVWMTKWWWNKVQVTASFYLFLQKLLQDVFLCHSMFYLMK